MTVGGPGPRPVPRRNSPSGSFTLEQKIEALARRLDELIDTVQRLRRDTMDLKEKEKEFAEEKSRLKAKNAVAKKRLESIIGRLRQHGGESS